MVQAMYYSMVVASLTLVASATAQDAGNDHIVRRLVSEKDDFFHQFEQRQQQLQDTTPASVSVAGFQHRHLQTPDQQASCDIAFLNCLPSLNCVECFTVLELERIDWTGVTPDTECVDVVGFLNDAGYCKKLKGDDFGMKSFCDTFHSCVVWSDDDQGGNDIPPEDQDGFVNCTALTECKWEGMKENWLGDGICHDNMHGCYNTAICGFDKGDCCKDTCDDQKSEFKTCGQDGFACRDPFSEYCDSDLTYRCPNPTGKDIPTNDVSCRSDEQKYKLVLYDSFGDGWDNTALKISSVESGKKVYEGSLADGYQGTEYICLSKDPSCYNALTSGGSWGIESSWELKPLKDGAPAFAGSGSPSFCQFPVAGGDCDNTCEGKPKDDPTQDEDYRSFKQLYNCISEKCVIQLGTCNEDPRCDACFEDDTPEYCFSLDSYVAVVDCTMCSCTDSAGSDFCAKKEGPGAFIPTPSEKDNDNSAPVKCSSEETRLGAKAVTDFAECANMDQIGVMIAEFDQSNFGQLDQFETCAHSYQDEDNHGGHTALGCMQVLYNAMTNPVAADNNKNAPVEAIGALAKDLYTKGESFCNCAKSASDDCPLCPSFMNFKTLLYESLDACQALDEIDCAAWGEFHPSCKKNLESEYGNTDLKKREECEYVKGGCGGAGPFPAFRRLDCDSEIDSDAWSFYRKYEKSCLRGDDGIPPDDSPVPSPSKGPSPTSAPQNRPTSAPRTTPTLVPYNPADDDAVTPTEEGSKSHWFRNLVLLGLLGGGGYYIYLQRFQGFNFSQYRRVRNFGNFGYDDDGMGGGMYSNLNSSTTFEPPSLPPTPQMMGGMQMGGQQQMQTFMGTEMT